MFERLSFWRVGDKIGDISLGFMMIKLISVRKKIRHTFFYKKLIYKKLKLQRGNFTKLEGCIDSNPKKLVTCKFKKLNLQIFNIHHFCVSFMERAKNQIMRLSEYLLVSLSQSLFRDGQIHGPTVRSLIVGGGLIRLLKKVAKHVL